MMEEKIFFCLLFFFFVKREEFIFQFGSGRRQKDLSNRKLQVTDLFHIEIVG